MAYHLISEEVHEAPDFQRVDRAVFKKSYTGEYYETTASSTSKTPNGGTIKATFKTWRCGLCRALFVGDTAPKTCGKCHA